MSLGVQAKGSFTKKKLMYNERDGFMFLTSWSYQNISCLSTLQTRYDWAAWVGVCYSRGYLMRTAIRGPQLGPGTRAIHFFFALWK